MIALRLFCDDQNTHPHQLCSLLSIANAPPHPLTTVAPVDGGPVDEGSRERNLGRACRGAFRKLPDPPVAAVPAAVEERRAPSSDVGGCEVRGIRTLCRRYRVRGPVSGGRQQALRGVLRGHPLLAFLLFGLVPDLILFPSVSFRCNDMAQHDELSGDRRR